MVASRMGSADVGRCLRRQALKWPAKSYPDKVVTVHQAALEFATIHTVLQVCSHLAALRAWPHPSVH